MPFHDWTRVESGTFHAFHLAWLGELQKALNGGILPSGYYALAEQRAGDAIPVVLGLHESDADASPPPEPSGGGVATITTTRPKVEQRLTATKLPHGKRRTLAIRHTSGHRIVALVEIVSPANKDRVESVAEFGMKVIAALNSGIHVLLIDPFPPGSFDPLGMHGAIWRRLSSKIDESPMQRPLTCSAYAASNPVQAFVNHLAVGDPIPDMPLFLTPSKYVPTPLEQTYMAAYAGMPEFWRKVIEKSPG